ncbi:MAG TPA: class I SAM-dependent methyltransferase [Acidobacteriota bacterium]|nr:class I SAM-dependent methyltransferase [Acidobacteriota bacterium]
MNDITNLSIPERLPAIEKETKDSGFSMASDYRTGSLLRTLVTTKRKGRILELGTGTGLSTCWLLDGMDEESRLTTVDNDSHFVEIAKRWLSEDSRVEFYVQDGSEFLRSQKGTKYDLIFADTWPGKYWDLDLALDLLGTGGVYVIDDMLPQENWPEDHLPKVAGLIEDLESRRGFQVTKMNWSTGIIIVTKA